MKLSSRRGVFVSIAAGLGLAGCFGSGDDTPQAPTATPVPEFVLNTGSAQAEFGTAVPLSTGLANASAFSFRWDFGDGSVGTEAAPLHTYAEPGTFPVSVTVTSAEGSTRTVAGQVTVGRFAMLQGSVCSAPNQRGWCLQRPRDPSGLAMATLAGSTPSLRYRLNALGWLQRSLDAGATWAAVAPGAFVAPLLQAAGNDGRLWVLATSRTGQPRVFSSADGGSGWTEKVLPAEASGLDAQSMVVLDANRFVINGAAASVVSTDGGTTWQRIAYRHDFVTLPAATRWRIANSGTSYTLFKSADLGQTEQAVLTQTSDISGASAHFIDDLHGWFIVKQRVTLPNGASPSKTRVFRTRDGGSTWAEVSGDIPSDDGVVPKLTFFDPLHGWATSPNDEDGLTDEDGPYHGPYNSHTDDGGETWQSSSATGIFYLRRQRYATRYLSAQWAYVGRTDGAWLGEFAITADGGKSWTLLKEPCPDGEIIDSALGPLQVTEDGVLRRDCRLHSFESRDIGQNWQQVRSESTLESGALNFVAGVDPLRAIVGLPGLTGFGTRPSHSLLRTLDGGLTWALVDNSANVVFRTWPEFTPGNTAWALIGDGNDPLYYYNYGVARSDDLGSTWQRVSSSADDHLSTHFIDANRGWMAYVPYGGGYTTYLGTALATTTDGGKTWQSITSTATANALSFVRPLPSFYYGLQVPINKATIRFVDAARGFAIGDGPAMYTVDGGASWKNASFEAVDGLIGKPVVTADGVAWMLGVDVSPVRRVVLRSTDAGATWQRRDIPTEAALTDLAFVNGQRGWVVGAKGTVLRTDDGGATWTAQESGTTVALSSIAVVDGQTLRIVGDKGVILATATGGR